MHVGAEATRPWPHCVLFFLGHTGGVGCGEGAVPGVQSARGEDPDILGIHAISSG